MQMSNCGRWECETAAKARIRLTDSSMIRARGGRYQLQHACRRRASRQIGRIGTKSVSNADEIQHRPNRVALVQLIIKPRCGT